MSLAQLNHVSEKTSSVDTVYSFQFIPSCFLLPFLHSWSPRLGISHLELQNYSICLCALCYRSWPIYTNNSLGGHLNPAGLAPSCGGTCQGCSLGQARSLLMSRHIQTDWKMLDWPKLQWYGVLDLCNQNWETRKRNDQLWFMNTD